VGGVRLDNKCDDRVVLLRLGQLELLRLLEQEQILAVRPQPAGFCLEKRDLLASYIHSTISRFFTSKIKKLFFAEFVIF
jgi:hypothetical protein